MNLAHQGLELNWTGKTAAQRVARQTPFHALEPVSAHGVSDSGNLLVQGDNLLALKSLLPFYKGRVKCIFIDPPYNTGSAFEQYDDKLQHSQWLSMMLPRLELLKDLLSPDGSIWVMIDDNEGHYLKVLMDEVFGRENFVANVVWQKSMPSQVMLRVFLIFIIMFWSIPKAVSFSAIFCCAMRLAKPSLTGQWLCVLPSTCAGVFLRHSPK